MNWYDYGARFYGAQKVSFTTQDSRAESYYSYSPYNYVGGNPIIRVDVNGEFIGTIIGTVVGTAAGDATGQFVLQV